MEVVFLGTAGSVPTRERSLPSVAVVHNGRTYLLDCGEGTQRQFFLHSLNISKVDYIFISHVHGDHIIGIAGLIRTLAMNNRSRPLTIFIPAGYEESARMLIGFDRAVIRYQIILRPIRQGKLVEVDGITVGAFRLLHSVPTYGFTIKENDRLRFDKEKCRKLGIKGEMFAELEKGCAVRVGRRVIRMSSVSHLQKGKRIAYITDTRPAAGIPKACRDVDLMIHEATYMAGMRQYAVERGHSTSAEAATMARRAGAKELVLFHISARYKDTSALLDEAKAVFRNTRVAYDGMKIRI